MVAVVLVGVIQHPVRLVVLAVGEEVVMQLPLPQESMVLVVEVEEITHLNQEELVVLVSSSSAT
jgi:hypothetical protein